MTESAFNDYMQNQIGMTKAQWAQAKRNYAEMARLAYLYVFALQTAGFTREEAIQIYCALNGYAQTMMLVAPREDAT